MRHIVHLVQCLDVGGMENGIVNLANMIDKKRFRLSICCLSHKGGLAERITDDGVTVFSMGWTGGLSLRLITALASELNARNVDLVHTHGWLTFFYGTIAAKLAGIAYLINGEHGTFNLEQKRRKLAYKFLATQADKFVTVSGSLRETLNASIGIDPEKIVTIPNGVDAGKFSPRRMEDVEKLRETFGIPKGASVIGTVGRMERVKNVELLVHAFHQLSREFPALHCIVAGEGSRRANLQRLVLDLGLEGKVHFTGKVDRPQDVYPVLDTFALTSFSEGMSNTILEAMACAKPVVATNVGGNNEMVREGYNGFLVESGNVTELKAALSELVGDEGKRMAFGANARKTIEESFDLKTMISGYESIYYETMH